MMLNKSKIKLAAPLIFVKFSRLNHFNLRLRPAGLRPSCLTFGVTSACPMFAIWWLTYPARAGLSPAGIIDLARPHTLSFFFFLIFLGYQHSSNFSLALKKYFGVLPKEISKH